MSGSPGVYKVLSPVGISTSKRVPLAPPIPDLSGKTICALRHTFRADETFQMIEAFFRQNYGNITFISNQDMPDVNPTSPEQEVRLIKVLREKRCDVVLAGNGA
jgi:hypothetical protein